MGIVAITPKATPSSASSNASSMRTPEQAEREALLRKVQAENQAKVDELRRKKRQQKKKSLEEFKNARKQKNSEVHIQKSAMRNLACECWVEGKTRKNLEERLKIYIYIY